MISPFTGGATELVREHKEFSFRKESFEIVYHSWKCVDTGQLFTTDELDQLNITQVHNRYREKHNIPFPDQIRSIRKKYGLSTAKMSEVLGFGINTWRNYESGEVPQASNGKLITLAADPEEFFKLVEMSKVIQERELKKILSRVEQIIDEEKGSDETLLKQYLSFTSHVPNVYSGYREFGLDKLLYMIIYFAETVQPLKTKLNKLLFYADFLNYKKTGFSISGSNYAAIDLGPVPEAYDTLFEYFHRNKWIQIEYIDFKDRENIGEKFIRNPDRPFRQELFNEAELNSLEYVAEYFKSMSTRELIDLSHNEKAWKIKSREKSTIEYDHAFELSIG